MRLAALLPAMPDMPQAPDNLLLMDLPEAQTFLHKEGRLDRVEVLLEPGPAFPHLREESGEALRALMEKYDTGSLAANFDPANLLIHGFSPYESARALHGRIAHVNAKDARRASASRAALEVPLGHGDIDWLLMMGTFEEIGYHGWVTVVREGGSNRLADAAAGVAFLRRVIV